MNKEKITKLTIMYVNGTKDVFFTSQPYTNLLASEDFLRISGNGKKIFIMKNNILKWVIEHES